MVEIGGVVLKSIGHPTSVLSGCQPGPFVERELQPNARVGMGNYAESEFVPVAGSGNWQARRILPETETIALRNYIERHELPLEAVVAACWGELVRCYAGSESILTLRLAHHEELPGKVQDFLLPPPAAHDTVLTWLLNTVGCNSEPAQMPAVAVLSNQVNESKTLASKLSRAILAFRGAKTGAEQSAAAATGERLSIEVLSGGSLEFRAAFNPAHFPTGFMEALLTCLVYMLRQIPALDGQPVSKLELSPASLRAPGKLLWPDGTAPEGLDCVHELISKYSRRVPEQIAVVSREKQITYGELNFRANQLAQYLIAHGASPDSLIAVHLKRSADLLIAVLAVLKSGAAFLPLDVSLPAGRINGILKASESPIVVTSSQLAASVRTSGTAIILVDAERELWQKESGEDFESPSKMNHLAYTTYTSGSTGTPKGVMIEHRNVISSFAGMDGILGTEPGVWLASTSISFDIAVTELLWTLSRGFQVVIHEGDEGIPVLSGPESIAAEICQYGVTHLQGTPTMARMVLTDPAAPQALAKLKKLILGGEPFPPSLARTLLDVMTGDFYNVYGPTETTICATADLVRQVQDPLPIGAPLGNTLAYVLDEHGRILPPLAHGELFIGGPTVGRGYFRRPDLTAERFIPDPFSRIAGGRLYRTGDLVRMGLDGKLEFIDRLDSQVKIRGYRIELGEIEGVMRTLPAIEDAVVVVRGDASSEKTLAGFFTLRPGARASLEEVSGYLSQLLPSYMVPPSLTLLEAFPLNSNGKTDRAKLAAMAPAASAKSSDVINPAAVAAPSHPKLQQIERDLCAWCSELLKVPDVSPTVDFFEIGGQSLAAAELMHRLSKSYGPHIRLSSLIKVRTMRGLAELALREADGSSRTEPFSPVVEVRGSGHKTPLFLIAGLGGNVVNFELLSRRLPEDRPIYAIETRGTSRNLDILTTVEEMAEAYLEEVRRIQPNGPYYLCGYSFGGVIAFEMAQQLAAVGEELGIVGLIDTPEWHYTQRVMSSFNLLMRLRVLHGGAVKRVLFGPDRKAALRKRLNAVSTRCRVAYDHLRGRHLEAAIASAEQRNLRALTQYEPQYYSGEIHFFHCSDPALDRGADPLLGWGNLARHIIVSEIPGEHGSLTVEPYVGFLATALHQSLDSLENGVARRVKATRATRASEMSKPLVASV